MQTRLTQLVPSKTRRNELRAFAYILLERGESLDNTILMLVREKRVDTTIAREIVLWVNNNSFGPTYENKEKRMRYRDKARISRQRTHEYQVQYGDINQERSCR